MEVEDTEWKPKGRPRNPSESVKVVRALGIGDVKRIVHDDVNCRNGSGSVHSSCTLAQEIIRLRHRLGWKLNYYHEGRGTLVVRRIE